MRLKIEEELYPGMALKMPDGTLTRLLEVRYNPRISPEPMCILAIPTPKDRNYYWTMGASVAYVMEHYTIPTKAEEILYCLRF